MSANTDTVPPDREGKARLYFEHPDESPGKIGTLPYLIHPPGKLSSTASWLCFRDKTLLPMIQHRPDDPNLPNFSRRLKASLLGVRPFRRKIDSGRISPHRIEPARGRSSLTKGEDCLCMGLPTVRIVCHS